MPVLQSQMAELFESIVNSRSFLNNIDMFKSKLPKVRLNQLLFVPN
jgi:hypothetical protein